MKDHCNWRMLSFYLIVVFAHSGMLATVTANDAIKPVCFCVLASSGIILNSAQNSCLIVL